MADNVIVRVPEQQFIRGEDGYSPEVTIEDIAHGHSVTITDRDHPEGQSFPVLDGDSAYEQAVAGGYTKSEAQFNAELGSFGELSEQAKEAAPFYAEYGVTTKAEIAAAINGKRQIYAYRNSGLLKPMLPYIGETRYGSTYPGNIGYKFALTEGSVQTIYSLTDQWTVQEINLNDPAQRAEAAADQALIRMNSADASAQAAASSATAAGNAQTAAETAQSAAEDAQEAAEAVLASIPSDYIELSEDVEDLEQTTTETTIGPVAIATFDASAADMPLKGLTVNIEPVQAEGTPSPENPLPITGWTGANVLDDPKHALPINWNQIRTDAAQTYTADGITTTYDPQTHLFTIRNDSRTTKFGSGSTQCVVSSVAPIPGHRYALLGEYHEGVSVSAVNVSALRATASVGRILTMSAATTNTAFKLRITSSYDFVSAHPVGDVYSFHLNIVDITQLLGEEAAATATYDQIAEMFPHDWYPFSAGEITCVSAVNGDPYRKISVNWQNEAGTVYGGKLDVVNRKLNSYPYYSSYNGETIIGPWISSMDVYTPGATPTLGAQVVDMGGAATSYDLSDVPEITTLFGENTIWADCGSVTVTYGAYLETVKAYADQVADKLKSDVGYGNIDRHIVIDDLTFVLGSISQSGDADSSNTTRARTSNTLSFYGANTVKISLLNNLYEYSLRFYDIKTNTFLRSDSVWSTGDRTIEWNNDESIRVVVRLATNETIPNVTLLQNIVRFDYTLPEIFREPTPKGFETSGNTEILTAKTLSFTDGSQPINEYYIVASPLTRIAYKTSDFVSYKPLCVLPFAVIDNYAYGVTYDDNLVCVFTIQSLNDSRFVDQNNGTDACRKPAYVLLDSEDYQIAHQIDLTASNSINPTGWLNNSGFYSYNGGFLFCEYTRTIVQTCNIWKVTGDITDPSNWTIKLQLTLSGVNTGLKHMHCLVQDPFTNYLYMSTGDDSDGAATYYSIDLGETWVLLGSGEEKYHRYLNLIFTRQYIYYATDSFRTDMHYLYRTTRDANGVMSFSDIVVLQDLNNRLIATYGTVYLPTLNKLFLPERRDSADGQSCAIIVYDIDNDTVSTIDTVYSTGNTRIGFRCRYIDYVSRDNVVRCGFGASFPLHNGGYANYINLFNNAAPGYPVSQSNNLLLRFGEKHVSIDTNTH